MACADLTLESICREDGLARNCNGDEQAMINGMHDIMRSVYYFEASEINHDNFKMSTTSNASVLFFGESHTKTYGQIKTLGAINALTKKDDIILLEGADRNHKFDFDDCGRYLIYRIYLHALYDQSKKRSHKKYEGDGAALLERKLGLRKIYNITKDSYNLTGFNLASLKCGFWDDQKELRSAIRKITYDNMKARNQAMVEAIDRQLAKNRRVFVNAGFFHLPLGERLGLLMQNFDKREELKKRWRKLEEFYAHIDSERKRPKMKRSLAISDDAGSSGVVYNYLKNNNISYREYIHKNMYM